VIELPKQAGTYALVLRLNTQRELSVGRLGRFDLFAGTYIYLGSALGPGGLRARLSRHLNGIGSPHWHIDYLRDFTSPLLVIYTLSDQRLECDWSQAMLGLAEARIPAPGFGASDCRRACRAHLVAFPTGSTNLPLVTNALTCISPGSELHTYTI
jgi:Uri superfamily endonuclease